jgi:hypothetical protein
MNALTSAKVPLCFHLSSTSNQLLNTGWWVAFDHSLELNIAKGWRIGITARPILMLIGTETLGNSPMRGE